VKKTYNTTKTQDLIKEIERLRKFVPAEHRYPLVVTPEIVQNVVSDYFGIDQKFMFEYSNLAQYVEPRQIAIYVCHTMSNLNKSELGRLFKRNHASIINSIQRVTMSLVDDNNTSRVIEEIAAKCLDMAQAHRIVRSKGK
jgi:chromosomal replication initiation ATPase DnaA